MKALNVFPVKGYFEPNDVKKIIFIVHFKETHNR